MREESPRQFVQRMIGRVPESTPETWEEVTPNASDFTLWAKILFGNEVIEALSNQPLSPVQKEMLKWAYIQHVDIPEPPTQGEE